LAIAADPALTRAMALFWGVTPLLCPEIRNAEQGLAFALDWARAQDLVAPGDRVVYIQGTIPGTPTHNALLVHVVDDPHPRKA
jgi:pyruvate kinase